MGLGLAALGRPGYINLGHSEDLSHDYEESKMEQQTHHMLDLAYEKGVRYLDAAQSYGKAEIFLSSWLQSRRHTDVVVGSKWGYYYTAGWKIDAENHEIKEHTIERLNQQWPESKERLDPYLKLYQIHSATFESGVLENTDVLNRLRQIKETGYSIGLSVSGTKQADVIKAAMDVEVDGTRLFDAVQVTYNILEQSCEKVLNQAHGLGIQVIVKEGVANGRLTSRNHSAPYYSKLYELAEKHQVGIDSIALAYILSKPFISMVLSGAAVAKHLVSNLQAAHLKLNEYELDILVSLKMLPDSYWTERGALEWN